MNALDLWLDAPDECVRVGHEAWAQTPATDRGATRAFLDWLPASVQRYRHVEVLAARLQDVAEGRIRRLMVYWPPRHGKSEIVSRLFTAYFLWRFPARRVLLASYAKQLAQALSRNAQANYVESGGVLAPDQAAKADWATAHEGGMVAVGIGSGVTGRGGHLLVIDDSVKDAEEAASEAIAARNRDWYPSTWLTRAEPAAAQIIVTTRWPGKADLAGYALELEAGEHPEGWHILAFDAIRDVTPWDFPPTCTVEPDWRAEGEALCPERYPVESLVPIRTKSGFYFSALYQQRPKARDGVLFAFDDFVVVDAAPVVGDLVSLVRYWDLAGTDARADNDPDATSGVLMAKHRDGTFWVLDRAAITAGVARRDAFVRETADADRARYGSRVVQWFERQAGIGGDVAMQALTRLLAGHRVQTEPATGSKTLRAEPFASQVQARTVRLVRGAWTDAFRLQLCAFPFGAHDDDVDASSGAFAKVAASAAPVAVSTFSLG